MRTLTSFLLMNILVCASFAQTTWQRLYHAGTSYTCDLIELPSGNILTSMGAIQLLDPEGHIQHSSRYHSGEIYLAQTFKAATTDRLYFTTCTFGVPCPWDGGDLSLYQPVIGKMDSLGSTLMVRKYELNLGVCHGLSGGLEVTSDQGALIWGRDKNFYALRVDSNLEPIWARRIERSGGFQFIKELPSGDLLAGINMDTAGVVVARMDTNGSILWSNSYLRPRGMIHDALIESDSTFIITGITDTTQMFFAEPPLPAVQPKPFMMKLNGTGEMLWCRAWYYTSQRRFTSRPSRIKKTLDGQYVMLCNLGSPLNDDYPEPLLMKTDANGNILWNSSVGLHGYGFETQDLIANSDGGFMFSGSMGGGILPEGYGDLRYIYKSDNSGQFDCQGQQYPVQVMDLFPIDSSFTLSSVEAFATATAVLVIDSVLDPGFFTDYEACIVTGTSEGMISSWSTPRIHPNPTTGRITVWFVHPVKAASHYTLFDAMGRILQHGPLPTGAMQAQLDLSHFGKGSYIIRLSSPGGVEHSRVILE